MDGHHLVINYFVLGDQVVMTPVFLGGEPVVTESGKYEGNAILQDELADKAELAESLAMLDSSMEDILAGRTQPAKPALKKIADELGLKLDR